MYIAPCDRAILWSIEMRKLKEEYHQRFGHPFAAFNYKDFVSSADKCAAQVYLDSLKEALQ